MALLQSRPLVASYFTQDGINTLERDIGINLRQEEFLVNNGFLPLRIRIKEGIKNI